MVIITFRTMANKADVAMVRDIAGMIMITDLTDVWNCQAHSALPVGQLQKEGAEKPALIYTYICLLFFIEMPINTRVSGRKVKSEE